MKILDRKDCLNKMYQIIGAAMDVYNELGFGYSEPIYQECLSIVCNEKGIPWEREKRMQMFFHGQTLKKEYIADFVCYEDIIVEIKAVSELNSDHRGQLFNYLRITDSFTGILINFGDSQQLVSERYIYNPYSKTYSYVTRKDSLI